VAQNETETLAIDCSQCREPQVAAVRGEATVHTDDWIGTYRLIQCRECTDVSLVVQEPIGSHGELDRPELVYPSKPEAPPSLPHGVRQAFSDAVRCHEQGINAATAVMCRRALEGLAIHLGAKRGSSGLYTKLEDLEKAGELPGEMLELAQHVRIQGNEQAHGIEKRVTAKEAQRLLDFTKAVFEYAGFKSLVRSLREQEGGA
jgi:hypothetical protein